MRSKRLSHLFRLALQHLRQQVAGNGALAARELRHEPLRVGMRRKRDRRQPARDPALGPLVQQRRACVGERDAGRLQQLPRLVPRKAEIRAAQLGQSVRQAQAVQPEPWIPTGPQHDPHLWRQPCQKQLQPAKRVGRPQLVQIVDDEHHRLLQQGEVGQQPLDHRLAAEARRRGHPLHELVASDGRAPVDHRQPEPLGITLAALDRHPRDPPVRPPSTHERTNADLPLPAGAQTRMTPPGPAPDKRSKSVSRPDKPCCAGRRSRVAWRVGGRSIGPRLQRPCPGPGQAATHLATP